MILYPVVDTCRYQLDPAEQKLLDLCWQFRSQGKAFYPSEAKMGQWLKRSTRQVRRYLTHLKESGLLTWKRRGKKLTNLYYLGWHVWERLTKGRKVRRGNRVSKEPAPVSREEAIRALREIRERLPGSP